MVHTRSRFKEKCNDSFFFSRHFLFANGKLAIDDHHPCANDHCTCVEWLIFMYIQIGSTHVIMYEVVFVYLNST